MNIAELFAVVMRKKATAKAFRTVLERQLKEAEAAEDMALNSSSDDDSNYEEEIEKEEEETTDEEQGARKDAALIAFLNTRNSEGNTLLHEAAKAGLFDLVEELIGIGLDIQAKNNQQQTALDLVNTSREGQYADVAALLRSRSKWLSLAKGFNINRVIHMFTKAGPQIDPGRGIAKLLCIGGTGSGKSTFINERFGTIYAPKLAEGMKPQAQRIGGAEPIVEVGETLDSTTLYPYVTPKGQRQFGYVDLAGLFDNRGHEYRIVATSCMHWVANMPGGIQGLLVFIDLNELITQKAKTFRKLSEAVEAICKQDPKLLSSVRYVITKVMPYHIEGGITIFSICRYLQNLRELFIVKDMLRHKKKIFLYDLSAQKGDQIDTAVNSLEPKEATEFNFISHDNAQINFREFLQDLPTAYLTLKKRIREIPNNLENHVQNKKVLEAEIHRLLEEIDETRTLLNSPFQLDETEGQLARVTAQLRENRGNRDAQERQVTEIWQQIAAQQALLDPLNSNEIVHAYTVQESGFRRGARPRAEVNWTFGAPMYRMNHRWRGWGATSSELIYPHATGETGIDPWDGAHIYYVNDPNGVGQYHRIFRASEGLSEYSVVFYSYRKHLPENRQRIANYRSEIDRLETELSFVYREQHRLNIEHTRLEQERVNLTIREIETRNQQLQNVIQEKEKTIADNIKGMQQIELLCAKLRLEKADKERELAVNRRLFVNIRNITRDLEIKGVNIEEFQREADADTIHLNQSEVSEDISADHYIAEIFEDFDLAAAIAQSLLAKGVVGSAQALRINAETFGYRCHDVPRDGRCFYHAFIDQVNRLPLQSAEPITVENCVQIIAQHITAHQHLYRDFIQQVHRVDVNTFVNQMLRNTGELWADHIIILAAMRAFNMNIVIISSTTNPPVVFRKRSAVNTVYLGHEVEAHYQSLRQDPTLQASQDLTAFINVAPIDNRETPAIPEDQLTEPAEVFVGLNTIGFLSAPRTAQADSGIEPLHPDNSMR